MKNFQLVKKIFIYFFSLFTLAPILEAVPNVMKYEIEFHKAVTVPQINAAIAKISESHDPFALKAVLANPIKQQGNYEKSNYKYIYILYIFYSYFECN